MFDIGDKTGENEFQLKSDKTVFKNQPKTSRFLNNNQFHPARDRINKKIHKDLLKFLSHPSTQWTIKSPQIYSG